MDEIIILLNRNDDKCSVSEDAHSNTKENTLIEHISFSEGQLFKTYEDIKSKFAVWWSQNNHPMKTASSKKNEETVFLSDFSSQQIRFACKHVGKPRVRGE